MKSIDKRVSKVVNKFVYRTGTEDVKKYLIENLPIEATRYSRIGIKEVILFTEITIAEMSVKKRNAILAEMEIMYHTDDNSIAKDDVFYFCELIEKNNLIQKDSAIPTGLLSGGAIQKNDNNIYIPDITWLIAVIRDELGISLKFEVEELVKDYFWLIGEVGRKKPLFFARQITNTTVLEEIYMSIHDNHEFSRGIVLTSSENISFTCTLPQGNKILPLEKCIGLCEEFSIDEEAFKVPGNLIVRQYGFSPSFRSGYFGKKPLLFTRLEADGLRFIHQEGYLKGRKLHKDEIAVNISDGEVELKNMYRSEDSKEIREEVLQCDRGGYYWFEL